ncbi:YlxR family protein [Candidatus Dojkabacteria bacterium]|nr:YlxR family protein [Candidatus Dojkabacteria bacterium]
MCAVTREKLPKKDLIRFAVEEGKVVLDLKGKARSRGLNIKPELEVFDKLIKSNGIKRGLGIVLNETEVSNLREQLEQYIKEKGRGKKVVRISSEKLDQLLKS